MWRTARTLQSAQRMHVSWKTNNNKFLTNDFLELRKKYICSLSLSLSLLISRKKKILFSLLKYDPRLAHTHTHSHIYMVCVKYVYRLMIVGPGISNRGGGGESQSVDSIMCILLFRNAPDTSFPSTTNNNIIIQRYPILFLYIK